MRLPSLKQATSARTAAWVALVHSQQGHGFVTDLLDQWQKYAAPSQLDFQLAHELAAGTMRRWATLEYYSRELAHGKLKLRPSSQTLLHLTLYQLAYLDRVPAYAAINEGVGLARRYGPPRFAAFLNALARRAAQELPPLPEGMGATALAIRNSYPSWYVEQLLAVHEAEEVSEILELGNIPGRLMARVRPGTTMCTLEKVEESPGLYIQNSTPVELLAKAVATLTTPPLRILDMCSAPGGKALLAHDLFPTAQLVVNDRSEKRSARLRRNLEYYGVEAEVHVGPGEAFAAEYPFDLVILDVPCSNSGVLNKRPEARWRLTPAAIDELEQQQRKLLRHAATLINPQGALCYLTCSILSQENEQQLAWASNDLKRSVVTSQLQLPDQNGHDGGFVGLLQ